MSNLGTGPTFECVRFSIYGRSPLLQHYLFRHHLSEYRKPMGLAVTRTQVKEMSSDGATYKQLLRGHERRAQQLYDQYNRQVDSQEF